ncbi:protein DETOXIFICATION 21-like isoform X3 [Nymphaea colorata]|uniref:protein DETOXIFICATION 21-like isoform X3 n=1 Tax=Nymphaea colorata TaxID=210225 RepID=UPI00129DB16F|nr:protein DETOXIFICATION 21-like isoform X3 [Nymphaea colorata]
MASALETLCGQAFGAGQYAMLGIHLQRSWIVLLCTATCLLPLFIFAKPILVLLGQTESVSETAASMSLWFIPVLYSFVFSFSLQMYLQAQRKNKIIGYLAGVSLLLHVSLSWLLAYKLGMGVEGVLISMNLAYWIPDIGQLLFVLCGGCPMTWSGFSTTAFFDLWPVIKLSASSGVMLCLELWYNSVLILLTGNLKNATIALDALAICLNISGWAMMISLGFFAAASVRVSNELGGGSASAAKFSILVVVATSAVLGILLFVLFMVFRGSVAYVFTDDQEVVDAVYLLSPLLAITILLNSVQPVLSGVAVGGGWQAAVGYVNIACYYVVGVPLGLVLGYVVGLQVEGVWVGMVIGVACQTVVLVYFTRRTDWDEQVLKSKERVNKYAVQDFCDTPRND